MKAYESNLDVFASVFKRSVKHHFRYQEKELTSMMVIADGEHLNALDDFAATYCENRTRFAYTSTFKWSTLRDELAKQSPSMVLIQRQLGIHDAGLQFSMGPILESITQELNIPVLVLPHDFSGYHIKNVAVGFDHQIDNSHLVNQALLLKNSIENLVLVHVEEESVFNYYMDAISKIPGINTEYAEANIQETILKLSGDFFEDVKSKLSPQKLNISSHCSFGDVVTQYGKLINDHQVDLLVFEAEDDSKLAMHSLGQSLAIQFPNIATLLV